MIANPDELRISCYPMMRQTVCLYWDELHKIEEGGRQSRLAIDCIAVLNNLGFGRVVKNKSREMIARVAEIRAVKDNQKKEEAAEEGFTACEQGRGLST